MAVAPQQDRLTSPDSSGAVGWTLWAGGPICLVAGFSMISSFAEPADRVVIRQIVRYVAVAGAVMLAMLAPVAWRVERLLERIRRPGPLARLATALALGAAAWAYFLLIGFSEGRGLFPVFHDEHMYLLQARMLANGCLWLPPHPLGDFFESFNVIVKPVYAATYFPGTAIAYLPWAWFDISPAMISAAISGAVVGLIYRVTTEMIDGVSGLLAALLMMTLPEVRALSVMVMSHPLLTLQALAMIWCFLRWRNSGGSGSDTAVPPARRHLGWIAVMGMLAGWAAITRPLDAVCVAGPLALAIAYDMARREGGKRILAAALVAIVSAAPLLSMQLIFNHGVTGSVWNTPMGDYGRRVMPGVSLGLPSYDPQNRPQTRVPQIHEYYERFLAPQFQQFKTDGVLLSSIKRILPAMLTATVPDPLLLPLIPVGVLILWRKRLWTVWAVVPAFLLGYSFLPSFLTHYTTMIAPAVLLSVAAGFEAIRAQFPSRRVGAAMTLGVAALILTSVPEINPGVRDHQFFAPLLTLVNHDLDELPAKPAVVLFHYVRGVDVHQEPVYNLDSPSPDDAEVVRAHDLGVENHRIFDYYAKHPWRGRERTFYIFDRGTGKLDCLGPASELARKRGG